MKKDTDTIIVSNYKSIPQMQAEHGCGYWPIGDDVTTIQKHNIKYVLCLVNRRLAKEKHERLTHEKAEPYFIATLNGLPTLHKPSYVDESGKKHPGRQLLRLEKYAEIPSGAKITSVMGQFNKLNQGPKYANLKSMGIDLGQFEMNDFDSAATSA